MRRNAFLTITLAVLAVLLFVGPPALAQERDAPKVEVGVQFSSLTLVPPSDFGGDQTEPGFGGRLTYNITDHIAVEGEGNFYPRRSFFSTPTGGRTLQAQFGVKAGKRFERFGVFGKVRPGLISFSEATKITPDPSSVFFPFQITSERKTHFSTDIGGVLEFYPSRRIVTRFDAGDTIIRYAPYDDLRFSAEGLRLVKTSPQIKHNFQFTAGVGFRFRGGDSGGDHDRGRQDDGSRGQRVPRYEVGAQFTSLSLDPPRPVFGDIVIIDDSLGPITEPGFGGRFTYNVTDNLAFEAEGNFFTRNNFSSPNPPAGHAYQGQFGVKAGKRFERFGVFAKARPGFVGFSRLFQLVGTREVTFLGQQITVGDFRVKHKEYFSTDVGGVLEFYPSRRIVTRFDFGDTIIRYTERATQGLALSIQIVRAPPETKHNFQFSAGIGFRF